MRLLHAIHDFLPRHRAGSEMYAYELARAQANSHTVRVLAAEYDPDTPHGTLRWRRYRGVTVVELVNNWEFTRFSETYSSSRLNAQLSHALDAVGPEVLHVHNLMNLSVDLPRIAREKGIPVVATLHDYTLVCPSGGQRVHVREGHVCRSLDAARCARCFPESPFSRQMAAGRLASAGGRWTARAAALVRRNAPALAARLANRLPRAEVDEGDITRRLAYVRHVLEWIDLLIAPSRSIADEFVRLGADSARVEVSDYGFAAPNGVGQRDSRAQRGGAFEIGFVGTLVWHKGVHVLLEALRGLTGNVRVHIHGDTSVFPDYVRQLRAAAPGLSVVFHGHFDDENRSRVFAGIDVLVVPSLWLENSPLVIHEAFMHGVPVVAARTGGIPELVQHDVNGLLYEPFSATELRAALQRLVDEPVTAARLAAAVPRIKAIAEDAREWEERYRRVIRALRAESL